MNISQYLCNLLGIDKEELLRFSSTAPHRYKVYSIPKRNGGKRTIAHPSKELKVLQRLVVTELEKVISPHDAASAYIKGKSIKENAAAHMKNRYLLKMDLENFFNSITPTIFFKTLIKSDIEINREDLSLLRGLLFWKRHRKGDSYLSVGAPSSPFISNIVMKDFDNWISNFCNREAITYTRYADDMSFSTNQKDKSSLIINEVRRALSEIFDNQIKINNKKTVFSSKSNNRNITGIVITNEGRLSIGRDKKRLIFSMIHHHLNDNLPAEKLPTLIGLISFACHIEPDFHQRLYRKYGQKQIDAIRIKQ